MDPTSFRTNCFCYRSSIVFCDVDSFYILCRKYTHTEIDSLKKTIHFPIERICCHCFARFCKRTLAAVFGIEAFLFCFSKYNENTNVKVYTESESENIADFVAGKANYLKTLRLPSKEID